MKGMMACVTAGLLFSVLGTMAALANPYLGHPNDWCPDDKPECAQEQGVQLGLRQDLIGSATEAGNPVDVCTEEFPISRYYTIWFWNSALGIDALRTADSCNGADVKIELDQFSTRCPSNAHGCTYPDVQSVGPPSYSVSHALIELNPGAPTYFTPEDDGYDHATRDIAHEMGHVLGEGDYFLSQPCDGFYTLMDHNEACPDYWREDYGHVLPVDIENYHTLYHADPVQNVVATSPSPNTVNLWWDQIIYGTSYDIPNEKSFTIKRGDCSGSPTFVKTVSRNDTSEQVTGQPAGTWTYCIFSDSDADNEPVSDRSWWPSNPVTVSDPVGAPDLLPAAALPNVTTYEGLQVPFLVTMVNDDDGTAGAFVANIKFNGSYRSYPQGIAAFNDGLLGHSQLSLYTNGVTMNFAGGPMTLVADPTSQQYPNGQVIENDETNNSLSGGTLKVKPSVPWEDSSHNDIVTSPAGGYYAWVDRSAIETGFKVQMRRTTNMYCYGLADMWSTPRSYGAKLGTGGQTAVAFSYAHGYCYQLVVKVTAAYADSSWTYEYTPVWYP